MENGGKRMEMRVRPTLVIGIGQWGAEVAAAFARRIDRRAGRLPVIHAVALAGEGVDLPPGVASIPVPPPDTETGRPEPEKDGVSTDLADALVAELEHIRHLETVQASQRLGWEVENSLGSAGVLVAALENDGVGRRVVGVARLLGQLAMRDFAYRIALSAILLRPRRTGGTGTEGTEGAEENPPPSENEEWTMAADDPFLFDEGCTLLNEVNADGLLLPTGVEQADMVANWLTVWTTTPLQAALDHMPPAEAGRHFDTFGLAAWEFPLSPLKTHLARRWQWETLGRLLAAATGDPGSAVAFMERDGQAATPWSQDAGLRFRVTGAGWTTPALDRIHALRSEIDEAVEAEWARLDTLAEQGEASLEEASRQATEALAAEVDALLDRSALGPAEGFLAALEDAARSRAARLARAVDRCHARQEKLAGQADVAGKALAERTGRFPPCKLRTLVGLALRPWRLLHLWLLYREIGRRAGIYLAYGQSQWRLRVEICERRWQAAFYAGLAQAAGEEREFIAQLRAQLASLRDRLVPDRAQGQALARQLEAAALPAGLADHFYRQATGDGGPSPAGVLALYGPLSRWLREDWEAETLVCILEEYAQEQFAFLDEIHLDDLLARTYSGAALRRRMAALIEAAAPWWAHDASALSAEERARLCRSVMVGLPDADRSPLVDLLPDRTAACVTSCFSTGDKRQIIAVQTIQGLPLTGRPMRTS